MEQIPGKQEGSTVYVHEGYAYHLDDRGSSVIYRCATRSTTQCPGAATVWNGLVTVYTPHGGRPHRPNPTMIEEAHMRREIMEKCRETHRSLKDIFDQVCRGQKKCRHPTLAVKFSFNLLKPAMERERGKLRPPIPHSWEELAAARENYDPTRKVYRGSATRTDGSIGLIFASDEMLEALASSSEAYFDGTFKGIPAMYVLTSSRTTAMYRAIFERMLELAAGVHETLKFTMGDFERAAMSALRTTFPEASLHGCWFHYNQAVLRIWRRLGLDSAPTKALEWTMALPLAPADRFTEGLDIIARLADEIGEDYPQVLQFMRYMRTQWSPLASVVSVHGCPSRTNNSVESFHQTVTKKLGGLHPNIWKFLENLSDLIIDQSINLARLRSGTRVRRLRPLRNIHSDATILDAQEKLALRRFTMEEFLLRCSTRTETWFDVTAFCEEPEERQQQEETQALADVAWMAVGEPAAIPANANAGRDNRVGRGRVRDRGEEGRGRAAPRERGRGRPPRRGRGRSYGRGAAAEEPTPNSSSEEGSAARRETSLAVAEEVSAADREASPSVNRERGRGRAHRRGAAAEEPTANSSTEDGSAASRGTSPSVAEEVSGADREASRSVNRGRGRGRPAGRGRGQRRGAVAEEPAPNSSSEEDSAASRGTSPSVAEEVSGADREASRFVNRERGHGRPAGRGRGHGRGAVAEEPAPNSSNEEDSAASRGTSPSVAEEVSDADSDALRPSVNRERGRGRPTGRSRGRGRPPRRGRGRGRGRGAATPPPPVIISSNEEGSATSRDISPSVAEEDTGRDHEASPSRGTAPVAVNLIDDDESIYHLPEDDYMPWIAPEEEIPFHPVTPVALSDPEPRNNGNLCAMCKVSTATHALIPCGHRCSCEDCVGRLKELDVRCPLCRVLYTCIILIRDG